MDQKEHPFLGWKAALRQEMLENRDTLVHSLPPRSHPKPDGVDDHAQAYHLLRRYQLGLWAMTSSIVIHDEPVVQIEADPDVLKVKPPGHLIHHPREDLRSCAKTEG